MKEWECYEFESCNEEDAKVVEATRPEYAAEVYAKEEDARHGEGREEARIVMVRERSLSNKTVNKYEKYTVYMEGISVYYAYKTNDEEEE